MGSTGALTGNPAGSLVVALGSDWSADLEADLLIAVDLAFAGTSVRMPAPRLAVAQDGNPGSQSRIGVSMDAHAHIEGLNRRFGIDGVAQVVAGNGGLPKVHITAPAAHADVYLYGAQVTSWRPAGAEEVLFLSSKSHWEPGKAIRGGIPVCFPWFGDKAGDKAHNPPAPKHGFVRIKEWRLDSLTALDDGGVTLVCVTESDAQTRQLWPCQFCLAYRITIGSKLRLELTVINSGSAPMRYEELLHTYFRVAQAGAARVEGLGGSDYIDKPDHYKRKHLPGEIQFTTETDRVFPDSTAAVDLIDPLLHRRLRTEKVHADTTVVWNPGEELAATLPDLADEWQQMVCVEAGNVMTNAVLLEPGEEHTLRSTLSVHSNGPQA